MKKNSVLTYLLMAIMGVLIVFEIVVSIVNISTNGVLASICPIVSLIFVALYGLLGYKKPHGNMLRYAMLILAFAQMLHYSHLMQMGIVAEYINIVGIITAGIIIYVAGRLHRIEQNKYLLAVVLAAELIAGVICIIQDNGVMPVTFYVTYLFDAVSIIPLMISYFVRFKEHKEAGITEKK